MMTSSGGIDSYGYGDWYEGCTGELEQGDIILGFAGLLPDLDEHSMPSLVRATINVVVLTQSCDIPKPAQKTILLAQVLDHADAAEKWSHYSSSKYKDALAHGTSICDVLLPPTPDGALDFSLVLFRNLLVLPKTYVMRERSRCRTIRLSSPYKEYLAQSYARFMMRVGLPTPLQDFAV